MNERDSEAVGCLLEQHGMQPARREEDADIILLNTCSVREMAESKALGKAGILLRLKRRKPKLRLVIMGCMAQRLGEQLLRDIPHLDAVVGTDQMHRLPELIERLEEGRRQLLYLDHGSAILDRLQGHRAGHASVFISVMRGCNQFCTYCIVPLVRGREKSRPAAEIVGEAFRVAEQGAREIILLGQNITAYGLAERRQAGLHTAGESPFAELLQGLNAVPGIERIRFTSPHPKYMNKKFIDTVSRLEKVCESFHIPLQSGSDRILQAMRRGYTAEDFRQRIASLRRAIPGVTFSTDIIVGFPGESEDDFQATRALLAEVGFDMAYVFKYSPRRGTAAASRPDDVPSVEKEKRNRCLLDDLARRGRERNRHYLGRTVEVMLEGPSKRNRQRWSGRTRDNKVCLFEAGPELRTGRLAMVQVDRVTGSSLFGRIVAWNES